MADYGQLDDFGDLTVEQLRNMPMHEYAELRRNSQQLVVSEVSARDKRDTAMFHSMVAGAYGTTIERWRAARERFINGDDSAYDEMLANVQLGVEGYDDA